MFSQFERKVLIERNSRSAPDCVFTKLDRRRDSSTTRKNHFVARDAARRGIARPALWQGQPHRSSVRGRWLFVSDTSRQRFRLRNRIMENRPNLEEAQRRGVGGSFAQSRQRL